MKRNCRISILFFLLSATHLYGQEWKKYSSFQGLPSNNVLSLVVDQGNRVWAGTTFGLAYYSGDQWTSTLVGHMQGTAINKVWSTTDTLWVGTRSNGLWAYDGVSNWKHFHPNIAGNGIVGFGKDSQNTVWILDSSGSFDKRVAGSWEEGVVDVYQGNGLFFDNQDNAWLLSGGLRRYKNGDLKSWSNTSNPAAEDYTPGGPMFDMVQDEDGLYWIASDKGLLRFDGTSFQQVYTAQNSGLASTRTRCLSIGKDGALWIGTWDGGISKLDGTNWVTYNINNSPLESNLINSITVDGDGKIWIASGFNSLIWPTQGKGIVVLDEHAVVGNGNLPATPRDLTTTVISINEVEVQWTDVANNEGGYLIERSTDGITFEQIKFVVANTVTFTDLTVTQTETYFYRVRATNTIGNSDYSNTAIAHPRYCAIDNIRYNAYAITTRVDLGDIHNTSFNCFSGYYNHLDKTTAIFRGQTLDLSFAIDRCNITTDEIIGATVYIDWNADGDFDDDGERVFQNLAIEGKGQFNVALTVPDVVSPGTTGRLRFRTDEDTYGGIGPCGYGEETQDYTIKFSEEVLLGQPSRLSAEALGAQRIRLTWQDDASTEDGYTIQRSFDGINFSDIATTSVNTISYLDESLSPGKTYYYKVRAIKGDTSSPLSDIVNATTLTVDFFPVTEGEFYEFRTFGVGGSWIDYDNDNDLDLYNTGADVLFQNQNNVLNASSLSFGQSGESSWADFDNDGDADLLASYYNYSAAPSTTSLYINNGEGNFSRQILETDGRSTNPVWVDYDRDGHLDIFLPYLDRNYGKFYRNNGDKTFIPTHQIPRASGFTSFGDYDNDGDDDLLSFNFNGIVFYVNNGDGTFTEANNVLPNYFPLGRLTGASWGDFDNDGDLDIFVACGGNYDCNNIIYINNGNGKFQMAWSNVIEEAGGQSNGSAWEDFDNDGYLDLAVANTDGVNFLYRNRGDGTFQRILRGAIPEEYLPFYYEKIPSMGCAWGDYNRDGFVDLVIFNSGVKSFLYANGGNDNHWVSFKLVGNVSNKSAIGAIVKIKVKDTWQTRVVMAQTGFAGQNSLDVEFGLGAETIIDRIEIKWPSGIQQTLTNVAANQFHTIVETEDVTGVHESLLKAQLYPNPTSSDIIIRGNESFSQATASITDMNGVLREAVVVSNPEELLVNVESLPPGLYILNLSSDQGIQHWKFIKANGK